MLCGISAKRSQAPMLGGLLGGLLWGLLLAGPVQAELIKVGLFSPMSGAVAVYGTEVLAGANFALAEIERSKPLGANQIRLITADTGGNPGTAAQAVQRLVDQDEVVAVLGGSTSPETAAAIEVTRPAEVLQLSPLAQDTSLTKQGNIWFARITQTAAVFSSSAAEWVIDKQGAKSVFILARNDNYGQSLADAFEETVKRRAAKLAGRIAYEPTTMDFKPLLARIVEAKPDFVSILGFYTDTGLIVKQMGELGIKVAVFANTSPAIPQFRSIAGPASEGAYGALYYLAGSIDTPEGKRFLEAWRAQFKRDPTQYEAMGYDVMSVLAAALKRAGGDRSVPSRKAVRDAVYQTENFPGATGPITILPTGDVKRPLPFVQLRGETLALDFLMR